GVPDTYQGTEFWDFNLVDPDNRRAVDFEARSECLTNLDAENPLWFENVWDDRLKLHVISRALRLRRRDPDLFATGDYHGLKALGERADRTFAFLRTLEHRACLVAVPRLTVGLGGQAMNIVWGDTHLALPAKW